MAATDHICQQGPDPVIFEPYVIEEQFRNIVDTVNEKLRLAFDPCNKRNWVDAMIQIGLTTFWLWEEIFLI